jgi:hypothetical protein
VGASRGCRGDARSRWATPSRSRRTSRRCCGPASQELTGVDLAEADVPGLTGVQADVRDLPFEDRAFDLVLCVSTLEHVGADNTGYGLDAEDDGGVAADRAARAPRVLAPRAGS